MGHFFQVQDDFLDCFGNPDITGKIGTDIQDNKCSWLAVVCMQFANDEQKQIMIECYGRNGKKLYMQTCKKIIILKMFIYRSRKGSACQGIV